MLINHQKAKRDVFVYAMAHVVTRLSIIVPAMQFALKKKGDIAANALEATWISHQTHQFAAAFVKHNLHLKVLIN